MAGTRSSARLNSSPASENGNSGTKRKADESSPSSSAKRGRRAKAKEQTTLEESMPATEDKPEVNNEEGEDESKEVEHANGDSKATTNGEAVDDKHKDEGTEAVAEAKDEPSTVEKTSEENAQQEKGNALNDVKADEGEEGTTTVQNAGNSQNNEKIEAGDVKADAVKEDNERKEAMPSNILEKGIIYFFTRGRVGIENPEKVQDLQRSYFVLRPLPDGARLTDGAIQDVGNNRLIALPKKVWPKSGKDRFMVFVEKAKTSMSTLKDEFFQGSDYVTQTQGTRHTPEVTPIGEGVYAITSSGDNGRGTTHLAYMLTIPSELGDVQKDVGLAEKGSFIMSVKNPNSSTGNAAVALPQTAEYPNEILEEFGGRAWAPAEPKHINYNGAALLLIGESIDSSSSLEPAEGDKNDDAKETPQEELEKLENEDELRVENLAGDDSVFADLGISSKEYPKVMTTW